jgi:hypothetical protein
MSLIIFFLCPSFVLISICHQYFYLSWSPTLKKKSFTSLYESGTQVKIHKGILSYFVHNSSNKILTNCLFLFCSTCWFCSYIVIRVVLETQFCSSLQDGNDKLLWISLLQDIFPITGEGLWTLAFCLQGHKKEVSYEYWLQKFLPFHFPLLYCLEVSFFMVFLWWRPNSCP